MYGQIANLENITNNSEDHEWFLKFRRADDIPELAGKTIAERKNLETVERYPINSLHSRLRTTNKPKYLTDKPGFGTKSGEIQKL